MNDAQMRETDAELLGRYVRERSEEALRLLIERHAPAVRRSCQRFLRGDAALADDAAQAVFIVLARKAETIRNPEALGAWLFRTASLVARQARRDRDLRGRRERSKAPMTQEPAAAEPALREEDREELYAAIAGLRAHEQDAVVLHYLRGLPREDVARALGCSLDALHKRLGVALERLQAALARRGVTLGITALGTALAQEAAQGSGAAVAAAWTHAIVHGAPAAKAGALAQGALKTMFWMNAKPIALGAVAAVLALASAAYLAQARETPPAVAVPAPGPAPAAPAHAPAAEPPLPSVRPLGLADFQAPNTVRKVAFSPDSKYLATACTKEVLIWDLATRTVAQRIPYGEWTWDMRFLSNERLLIAAEDEGFHMRGNGTYMVLWDLAKKELVREFKAKDPLINPCRIATCTPDGRYGFIAINGNKAERLLIWDLATGKLERDFDGISRKWSANSYHVDCMGLSSDGRLLATLDTWQGYSAAKGDDSKAKARSHAMIWDWSAQTCEHEWELPSAYGAGHFATIRWLANDTQVLLDGVYKFEKTRCALLLEAATGKVLREWTGMVALSEDGKTLVHYEDKKVKVLDFASGQERATVDATAIEYPGSPKLSPDGRWLACDFNEATFMLVDLQEKRVLAPGGGFERQPFWMRYNPDGKLLTRDRQLNVFDDATGKRLARLSAGIYYIACNNASTADGRIVLSSGGENGRAELWDLALGTLLGSLSPHSRGGVQYLSLSPDGSLGLTVGEYNGTFKVHDLKTGADLFALTEPQTSSYEPRCNIREAVFAAKSGRLFIADATLAFMMSAEERKKCPAPAGFSGAFDARTGKRLFWFKNKDGKPIEVVQNLLLLEADDLVLVRESNSGEPNEQVLLCKASDGSFVRALDAPGWGMALTPDHTRLVGSNASIELATGKTTQTYSAGTGRAISPSGLLLAVLDGTPSVRIVDSASGVELLRRDVSCKEVGSVVPERVVWHPDEMQLALFLKEKTAVLQVDLLDRDLPAPAKPADAAQIKAWAGDLGSQDPNDRERARDGLAAAGEAAHGVLMELLGAGKPPVQESVLAVFVLEIQARRGLASARARLDEWSKRGGDDVRGQAARASLWRLAEMEKARALRKANDQAAPLAWPANTSQPPKEDF